MAALSVGAVPPPWIAFQIRSGVQGMRMSDTPNGRNASTTAFTTAGVDAIVPASPTPLAPRSFVVDGDVDVRSWSDVMWAVATRMDPSRDLVTVDRTPMDTLDFASPLPGLGGKLGIDATLKIGAETTRDWSPVLAPDAAVARVVERRWGELFTAGTRGRMNA